MAGFTDYGARLALACITASTSYISLLSAIASDSGSATEISGNGYARAIINPGGWTYAGSAPLLLSNSSSVSFPTPTANWVGAVAFGIHDVAVGGNLVFWDYLGQDVWKPFSCAASVSVPPNPAAPAVFTSPAHGLSVNDSVMITAEFGGALPSSTSAWPGTHTVQSVTTDTFSIGIITTTSGSGSVKKAVLQNVNSGFAPAFVAGTLVISQA